MLALLQRVRSASVAGGLLIVSQFTLAADTTGGNRPSFSGAAPAALGRALYDEVTRLARQRHPLVETGDSAPTCRSVSSTTGR